MKENNQMKHNDSEKTITISFQKAMAILAGAILSSVVGTLFTTASIINNDHYTVISHAESIRVLQEECVLKSNYEIQTKYIIDKIDEMSIDLKEIIKATR